MLRFQRQGVLVYDLGGWYAGTKDKGKLGVNRFKASFGGVIVKEFNAERYVTAIGCLAMVLLRCYRYCAQRFNAAWDAIVQEGVNIVKVCRRLSRTVIENDSPDAKDVESLHTYLGGSTPERLPGSPLKVRDPRPS